jgi:hypothetical protein
MMGGETVRERESNKNQWLLDINVHPGIFTAVASCFIIQHALTHGVLHIKQFTFTKLSHFWQS